MMALPLPYASDDFVLYPANESDSNCMSYFDAEFVEEARVLINSLADAPINVTNGSPSSPAREAEAFDRTLDSPLGLADLRNPFDYSPLNEYLISPLFTARVNTTDASDWSQLSTTPDLSHSSLEMDLFAPSPTPGLVESPPDVITEEVQEDAMGEEYSVEEVKVEEVKAEEKAVAPTKGRTTRSSARKAGSKVVEAGARSQSGKRLFNGTRSTAFEIVPLDAPIQKRNFSTPSRTSRKRLPKAVERILPAAKRQGLKSVKVEEDEEEEYVEKEAEDLPKAVEDLVERKRKENTLAARVSRQRKKDSLEALLAANEELKAENSELQKENERLREQLGMD